MNKRALSKILGTAALGGLVASGAWAGDAGAQDAQGTQDRDSGYSAQPERAPTDAGSQRGVTGSEQEPGMAGQQGEQQQQQFGEEPQGEKQQYVVREGDTLAGIAERFLGSSEQWQRIAEANDIENPDDLRVGMSLTIPERDEATTGERRSDESEPLS